MRDMISARSRRAGAMSRDQLSAERLRRAASLLHDMPASAIATLAVLSAVEQEPRLGAAICAAVQPVASLVPADEVAINVALLHRLVDEGMLAVYQEGPAPGRKGRLYALTAQGVSMLAELRDRVREVGARSLVAAAADLETLAGWSPQPSVA
jgi:hypothetical protein